MTQSNTTALLIWLTPFALLILGHVLDAPLWLTVLALCGAAATAPHFARTQAERDFKRDRARRLKMKR